MSARYAATYLLLCGLTACFNDPGDSPTSATESSSASGSSGDGGAMTTSDSTLDPPTSSSGSMDTATTGDSSSTSDASGTTSDGPTSTTGGSCGDGVIDPGEECDDGPANADDAACSSDCVAGFCGDGQVQPALGEECDDGPDNADDTACTEACKTAECGDGFVWEGVEECDKGEGNKIGGYGDCTPVECLWWGDYCGDGVLQKDHEECDLGVADNEEDGNACTKSCLLDGKAVFVTSKTYKGALGGLTGADASCNLLALEAGVANAGKFMAWLSTDDESPASRMNHSEDRYVLLDGETIVANTWSDLTDGLLGAVIDVDETGTTLGSDTVWTGTTPAGLASSPNCLGWTSDSENDGGVYGVIKESDETWSQAGVQSCSWPKRLICIEQ